MKIIIPTILLALMALISQAQNKDSIYLSIQQYHNELNAEYADPVESPLQKKHFKKFKSLDIFPIDLDYYIVAKFVRTPNQKPFKMATSDGRKPIYEKYGEAHFTLNDQKVVLEIYQNHALRTMAKYKDYLFLPFTDLSNGEETYGGGRYLGLTIPEGDSIIIDFNKAYNPYCAYNDRYSCPLVPRQNRIMSKVLAGVKAFKK